MNNETKQTIINAITALLLVTLIAGAEIKETPMVYAQNNEVVATATPKALELTTVTHKEVVEDTPENYIREVFGEYSDKAFLLLKGVSKVSCAENRTMNPKAKYENVKNGKVWSTDRGMFMINDKYHPSVSNACAYDYKCNTNYAYRMFKNDGYTFSKRWAVGECLSKLGYEI